MMFIFLATLCVALGLSAIARWRGASRWVAVGLPTFPAIVVFIYYVIRHDEDFGPHGVIPAWAGAGIILLLVAAISVLAALGVGGRT